MRPFLDETTAGALLQSAAVRRRRTRQAWAIGREELEDLGDLIVIPTPLDRAEASVTKPIVKDDDEMVLGVLFRFAHDVVPSSTGDGSAIFGRDRFEDNLAFWDPPLPGAVAEVEFVPPRADARYLIEFWCIGTQITVSGSDGANHTADNAISLVLYASRSRVHYVLSSPNKWTFRSCTISWLQT